MDNTKPEPTKNIRPDDIDDSRKKRRLFETPGLFQAPEIINEQNEQNEYIATQPDSPVPSDKKEEVKEVKEEITEVKEEAEPTTPKPTLRRTHKIPYLAPIPLSALHDPYATPEENYKKFSTYKSKPIDSSKLIDSPEPIELPSPFSHNLRRAIRSIHYDLPSDVLVVNENGNFVNIPRRGELPPGEELDYEAIERSIRNH